ncbi:hypothetical protein H257_14943 [Aphanomyces astaci]|uniref:Uncharacterized protein n=1 Tax=Aphanomyces astaci TaxID=112090 RepID=W4FQU3_APHAT|nr:hypothetical protein H257_14943 [Aphanomyces astaci]ETV69321.1 hypothetical protein H257_14943 [Aphanomyces astaci]|eukprot:XP_009841178.1 hypothetical protein H257_14943 [Aphanomyces astaci]
MTYVSGGQVIEKRSWLRLSIIPDIFWGIIGIFQLLKCQSRIVVRLRVEVAVAADLAEEVAQVARVVPSVACNRRLVSQVIPHH